VSNIVNGEKALSNKAFNHIVGGKRCDLPPPREINIVSNNYYTDNDIK